MRAYLDKVLIDGQSCERGAFGWTLNSLDCDTVEYVALQQLIQMPAATKLNRRKKDLG